MLDSFSAPAEGEGEATVLKKSPTLTKQKRRFSNGLYGSTTPKNLKPPPPPPSPRSPVAQQSPTEKRKVLKISTKDLPPRPPPPPPSRHATKSSKLRAHVEKPPPPTHLSNTTTPKASAQKPPPPTHLSKTTTPKTSGQKLPPLSKKKQKSSHEQDSSSEHEHVQSKSQKSSLQNATAGLDIKKQPEPTLQNPNVKPNISLYPGWVTNWSRSQKRWYFFDTRTNKSVWEWPPPKHG